MTDTAATIESVARRSYARLVAYLSARTRDVAAAEDALADAFTAALQQWPVDGVPVNPEGWLLTAARRRVVDRARHERVHERHAPVLRLLDRTADGPGDTRFPDDRLKLLFVCAHPAIDRELHTPLMLQVVLGLSAARISSAFLSSPATMGQRLSRAKAKIRDAGIAFEIPERAELPSRLHAVLEAIYAAYGSGWDDVAGADPKRRGLADEAVWLARLCAELLPGDPEALGLLALLLYCETRRAARVTPEGTYVPISDQRIEHWSAPLLEEAERTLGAAARLGRTGRFQLEAAIQSAHTERAHTARTDWQGIAMLYEGLLHVAPTAGALVGRAAALAEVSGPDTGLVCLERLDQESVGAYQPYWAVRAHLLFRMGRAGDAVVAFDRAIALTDDAAIGRFLVERREAAADDASRAAAGDVVVSAPRAAGS